MGHIGRDKNPRFVHTPDVMRTNTVSIAQPKKENSAPSNSHTLPRAPSFVSLITNLLIEDSLQRFL
jgi:hypothetical protein